MIVARKWVSVLDGFFKYNQSVDNIFKDCFEMVEFLRPFEWLYYYSLLKLISVTKLLKVKSIF